jgi:hypothetical protein
MVWSLNEKRMGISICGFIEPLLRASLLTFCTYFHFFGTGRKDGSDVMVCTLVPDKKYMALQIRILPMHVMLSCELA